jgi:uncharacterized damage-inducible protein DinB
LAYHWIPRNQKASSLRELMIRMIGMTNASLAAVFDGWDGYNQSIIHAIESLTAEQLDWRPSALHRPAGDLVRHIALGRLEWFMRMDAPGSQALAEQISEWEVDEDGNRHIVESSIDITTQAAELVGWLAATGEMVAQTLVDWTVSDLATRFRYRFNGQRYDIPCQWVIFRILAHDIHHGGELSLLLGMQGIEAFELSALGGHIVMPPLADDRRFSEPPG